MLHSLRHDSQPVVVDGARLGKERTALQEPCHYSQRILSSGQFRHAGNQSFGVVLGEASGNGYHFAVGVHEEYAQPVFAVGDKSLSANTVPNIAGTQPATSLR